MWEVNREHLQRKDLGLCEDTSDPTSMLCCNKCTSECQQDIFKCGPNDFFEFGDQFVDKGIEPPGIDSVTQSMLGMDCSSCSEGCLKEIIDCTSGDLGAVEDDYIDYKFPCFPGQSMVQVEGKGAIRIMDLNVHDRVLAQSVDLETLAYEPVLGFLHAVPGGKATAFLTIVHSTGVMRVSENHIVFVLSAVGSSMDKLAAHVRPGDQLLTVSGNTFQSSSRVLAVSHDTGEQGMYAPMTPGGRIVVDDVISSNYATHGHLVLPHCAAHATFFLTRAYYQSGLGLLLEPFWDTGGGKREMSKSLLASVLHDMLRLDKLLKAIQ
jgi:hypothetical protein